MINVYFLKDAEYIKQLDSQQRRLNTKEDKDKTNEIAKLKEKIRCKGAFFKLNYIIYKKKMI